MKHSFLNRSICLLLAVLSVLALPAAALEGVAEAEAAQAAASQQETVSADPFDVAEDAEPEPEGSEAEGPAAPAVEVPAVFVDEKGNYLAPEHIAVYVMRHMQEDSLSNPSQADEQYTGVVAFYDYSVANEKSRLEHPYFFYYEKGELQDEDAAFHSAKGYLDLTEAPVADSSVNSAVSAEEDKLVYVAEERYVDEDAEEHPAYLFAFQQQGSENGLYTGEYESAVYEDGFVVPDEPEVTEAPDETPAETPDETPAETPAEAPDEVPDEVSDEVPVPAPLLLAGRTAPSVVVSATENGIQIEWSKDAAATGYRILRSENNGQLVQVADADADTDSYVDSSAESGKTYSYAVRSYFGTPSEIAADQNYSGGIWSDAAPSENLYYLAAPVFKVSGGKSQITVSWNKVTGADSYRVWRAEAGGAWKLVATVSGTTLRYVDSGVKSGVRYHYTVWADNKSNGISSAFFDDRGDDAKAVSLHNTAPTVTAVSKPVNVAQITWSKAVDATGYRIYRFAPGGSWQMLANITSGSTTSYVDKTAENGQTYTYVVRPYYGDPAKQSSSPASDTEAWSGVDGRATLQFKTVAPTVTLTAKPINTVQVTWSKAVDATGYRIYRFTPGGKWQVLVNITSGSTTSYIDKTVENGQTYTYVVRTYYGDPAKQNSTPVTNTSAWSIVDGRATLQFKTVAPTVTATAKSGNTVQITWSSVVDATGYRVYRFVPGGSWQVLANYGSGTTSHVDKTAKNGQTYTYVVRTYYGDPAKQNSTPVSDTSAWSSVDGRTTLIYMAETQFSSIYSDNGNMKLQWNAVSGATGYIVYRRTSTKQSWTKLAVVNGATSYQDKTVKNGTSYYYAIRAYKKASNGKEYLGALTEQSSPYIYHAPLESTLTILESGYRITWKADSKATGYRVWRRTSSGVVAIASLPAGTTSYTDAAANLKGGQTYSYSVRAYYGSVDIKKVSINYLNEWSGQVWKQVVYLATPKPNATAENDATGIKVKWTTVTGAAGYYIYRRTETGSWKKVGTATGGTTNAFIDTTATKLASGTVCYYTVRAFSSKELSTSYYDTTGSYAVYLPQPSEVTVDAPASNGTKVTWTAVKGATLYEVFRRPQNGSSWTLLSTVSGTTYVDTGAKKSSDRYVYTVRPNTTATVNGKKVTIVGDFNRTGYLCGIAWSGKERNAWVKKNGTTYYVDSRGLLLTGWQYLTRNGRQSKYYFDQDTGALVTNLYSYFGKEYRNMKCRVEVCINSSNSNPSYITIYLYDQSTGSYCIPAASFRCVASLTETTSRKSAYMKRGVGERWLHGTFEGASYEQYGTRVTGTSSYFHSVLYSRPSPTKMMMYTYNSLIANKNNSLGCIRMQCIYAYLIQDIMKNGYGAKNNVPVIIYKNTKNAGPFGVPLVDRISGRSSDPTDPAITGKFFYDTSVSGVSAKAGAQAWTYY